MNKASALLSLACALWLFIARNNCEAEVINDIDIETNKLNENEGSIGMPLPYLRPPCCKQVYMPMNNAETNRLNEDHENSFDMMQPVSPPLLVLAPPPIPVSIPSESERRLSPMPIPMPPPLPGQWYDAVVYIPM